MDQLTCATPPLPLRYTWSCPQWSPGPPYWADRACCSSWTCLSSFSSCRSCPRQTCHSQRQLTAPRIWSLKPSHWFRELSSRQRILPHSLAMVFHFSIHSLLNVDGKIQFIVHLNTNIWNLLSPWLQFFSLHNLQTIRRLSGNCGGVAWRLELSTVFRRISQRPKMAPTRAFSLLKHLR